MTENSSADAAHSRQAGFVRCCLNIDKAKSRRQAVACQDFLTQDARNFADLKSLQSDAVPFT